MDQGGNIIFEFKTNYFRKGLFQILSSFGFVFVLIFLAANNFFKNNSFLRSIGSYFFPIGRVEEVTDESSTISQGMYPFKWMFLILFFVFTVMVIIIYSVISKFANWMAGKNKIYFNDAHYIFMDDGLNIINKKGSHYFPYENIQSINDTFMKMQMAASYFPKNKSKFILLTIKMKDTSSIDINIPREYANQAMDIFRTKIQVEQSTVVLP